MNRQNALLIALPLLLAFAYWYFFVGSGGQQLPLSISSGSSPSGQRFIDLASKLNALNFDVSIFDDARFQSLVSLETAITPENQGRVDPFAPLGR